MSTLSLRKIKHDSSSIDNITLNSNGTTSTGAELVVPSLKGTSGNKLQLRSGDSSFGVSLQNVSGIDLLTVDAVGRVTMPYQPAFRAYHNNNITWNSGANSPIVYNVTSFNIGNHYNTSTGIFTAPVAGRYCFTVFDMYMEEPSYVFVYLAIQINGSSTTEFMRQGVKSNYDTFGGTVLLSLSANDQVKVVCGLASVDSGYLRAGIEMNSFMGYLVS